MRMEGKEKSVDGKRRGLAVLLYTGICESKSIAALERKARWLHVVCVDYIMQYS